MLRSRRTPLALLLLTADRPRLALSAARVAFAVVLMFSQMGFLLGVDDSQNAILDILDADLVVVSKARYNLFIDEDFPRTRLYQARAVPGVESVSPLYVTGIRSMWRAPGTGREYFLRVLAVRPDDPVFLDADLQRQLTRLKGDDAALFDARSRDFLGQVPSGTSAELNRRLVRVVGTFQLGPDYRNDGNLVISDASLLRYFPEARADQPSLGLIRLRPGADPKATSARLAETLPPDVDVVTKGELARREADFWDSMTPTGIVFGFGLLIGFVVGMLTCYQVLHTGVKAQLPQFAALKAMGYPNRFLVGVVMGEATYLALLGFAPGVVLSAAMYAALRSTVGIGMRMTLPRTAVVGALTLGMCLLSAILAVREVVKKDPAEVFP